MEQKMQNMECIHNQRVEREGPPTDQSVVKMECIRRMLVQRPQWLMNVGELQQRIKMNEEQITRCNSEVMPQINMIEQNISNSKAYIDRLKSNNEEKLVLQQQIHDALTTILTKEQMYRLS